MNAPRRDHAHEIRGMSVAQAFIDEAVAALNSCHCGHPGGACMCHRLVENRVAVSHPEPLAANREPQSTVAERRAQVGQALGYPPEKWATMNRAQRRAANRGRAVNRDG